MPKAFLDDLRMNVRREHVAGVAVPQLVQRHAPFFQKLRYDVREAARPQGGAVRLGDDMPSVVGADPEKQKLLSLGEAPAAQLLDGEGGQGDRSRPAALGFLFPDGAGVR